MKTFIIVLVLLASVIGVLRLNLPANTVNAQIEEDREANFMEKAVAGMMFSDTIADWHYIDLVVVKFACSERLNMTLIALPFKRWKSYDTNSSICRGD